MKHVLQITMAMLVMSAATQACINDSELPQHEREFRSQYTSQQMMTETDATMDVDAWQWRGMALKSGGIAGLVLGAAISCFRRRVEA